MSFAIPVWSGLLTSEHRERMGTAIWVFLWLIDKTTKEYQDDVGMTWGSVLGGRPVKVADIADDLGVNERTVKRDLKALIDAGYIRTMRAAYGLSMEVHKSKKWHWKDHHPPDGVPERSDKSVPSEPVRSDTNVLSRSDKSVLSLDKNVLSTPERSDKSVPSNKTIQYFDNTVRQYRNDQTNTSVPDGTGVSSAPAENRRTRGAQHRTGNGDDYTPDFERFWGAYPRKVEKRAAFSWWQARVKQRVLVEDMIKAAQNYARSCAIQGTATGYIKHPSTFLGKDKPYEEWVKPTTEMMAARSPKGDKISDPKEAERLRKLEAKRAYYSAAYDDGEDSNAPMLTQEQKDAARKARYADIDE